MYTIDNVKVGKRLSSYRKSLHLSQETFAELLGISYSYYQSLEYGKSSMSQTTLTKIKNATRLSTDYLLFGDVYSLDEDTLKDDPTIALLKRCSPEDRKFAYTILNMILTKVQ